NARHLFAAGCAAGALSNAAIAWAQDPTAIILLRVMTGAALACVYPPGMKIAAGWFDRSRGAARRVLIGALTIGSAVPHLPPAAAATVNWRTLILCASALSAAGGVIVVTGVGDGPYVAQSSPFDPRAVARVFAVRATRLATFGYLGHMW